MADDCMGLAQQVAYSSLLAFFPAIVALIGLLDLVNAYDALQRFLNPVAPKAVTSLIETFQQDSGGRGPGVGRDGLRREVGEPRLRPPRDATVLEGAHHLHRPRDRVGSRHRGDAAPDR